MHGGMVVGLIVVLVLTYFCLYKGGARRFIEGDRRLEIAATICAMSWAQCWFGFNTASDPLLWASLGAAFLALRANPAGSRTPLRTHGEANVPIRRQVDDYQVSTWGQR
jgi:hypothetical protein